MEDLPELSTLVTQETIRFLKYQYLICNPKDMDYFGTELV